MPSKLYVGNVPFNTTEADLQSLFEQAGNVVSVKLITDKFSGRSKGFGFIEMGSDEDAEKAISEINGKELESRPLKVSVAQDKGGGGGGGGRGGRGGGGGGGYRDGGGRNFNR